MNQAPGASFSGNIKHLGCILRRQEIVMALECWRGFSLLMFYVHGSIIACIRQSNVLLFDFLANLNRLIFYGSMESNGSLLNYFSSFGLY